VQDQEQNFPTRPLATTDRRRRTLVAAGLLGGIVALGAVGGTLAADPSPSPGATAQPDASQSPGATDRQRSKSRFHRGGARGDCPKDGSDRAPGASPSPDASPDTNPSPSPQADESQG
jgi:hypothetical protein